MGSGGINYELALVYLLNDQIQNHLDNEKNPRPIKIEYTIQLIEIIPIKACAGKRVMASMGTIDINTFPKTPGNASLGYLDASANSGIT